MYLALWQTITFWCVFAFNMQNLTQPKIVFRTHKIVWRIRSKDSQEKKPTASHKNSFQPATSGWIYFPSMRLLSESLEIEIPNCPQQMVEENDTFSFIFISLSSSAITTVLCHYFKNFYKEEPHSHRFVNNVFLEWSIEKKE